VTPKYAAKKDLNHSEIYRGLVQLGFLVEDTSKMGDAFPDLVIKHPARPETGVRMVEIKSKNGKLRPGQAKLKEVWQDSIIVAYTIDDVLEVFGLI
jgi:hypothetical protein